MSVLLVISTEWQSQADVEAESKRKGELSLLEKHKRKFADKRKALRHQHAVKLSLEGKNMTL